MVGAQTADSPIRHTPDGKEVIRLFHCNDHELKNFPVFADVNAGSLEPIQPDVIGASSAVPPLQIEAATEKVLYLLRHLLCDKPIQTS